MTPTDAEPVAPIAEGGLLLHIGSPKAGSTAIQNALNEQRGLLGEHGAHYAGQGYRPTAAGWAVLGKKAPAGHPQAAIEEWEKLVAECREHAGERVCLSNEDLSRADDASAERIVSELGPERVHLLYVVRPLDRLLPSTWQERIKARVTSAYDDWLRLILGEPSELFEYTNYWVPRDLPAILERWGRLVPPERIVLICSDESDRALLPHAFESLLGLPAGALPMQSAGGRSNRGLTANESELMRRINVVARSKRWTAEEYLAFGQRGVAAELRRSQPSPSDQKIPALPDWALQRVGELSDQAVETVRSSGARVIGDPESLRFRPGTATGAAEISSVQIDTAVTAVLGAIAGGRRQAKRPPQGGSSAGRKGPAVSELSSKQLAREIAKRARRRFRRR